MIHLDCRNSYYVKQSCVIIKLSRNRDMRHLLGAAVLSVASLSAIGPANAKSFWLKCGEQVINLDSAKERFLLTSGGDIFHGRAMFSPGKITLGFLEIETTAGSGVKRAYVIDGKPLKYVNSLLSSFMRIDWKTSSSTSGKCSIMKTPPTSCNQI